MIKSYFAQALRRNGLVQGVNIDLEQDEWGIWINQRNTVTESFNMSWKKKKFFFLKKSKLNQN